MITGDLYLIAFKLLLSLILGVLFGIERDQKRFEKREEVEEDAHFGGIRTFALIGLLGGLLGYTSLLLSRPIYIYGFLAVAIFVVASYVVEHKKDTAKLGMTTEFSALLTYILGTLCLIGRIEIVIATSIVTLFLLSQKTVIKSWSSKLKPAELLASLKFALVLFVIFPFLKEIEPIVWQGITVLDPYRIWKMVVLISSISYFGYFLNRVIGQERGVLVSGVLGGFASSTAVTHAMSTRAALVKSQDTSTSLAVATLFATAVSFLRVLIILAVLNTSFLEAAWVPLAVMIIVCVLPGIILMSRFRRNNTTTQAEVEIESPFSLKPALIFGFIFAAVLLLVQLVQGSDNNFGLYLVSSVSGFTDVDAITITLSGLAGSEIGMAVGGLALIIAISSNLIFKCLIARLGGAQFWKIVSTVLAAAVVVGLGITISRMVS